MLKNFYLGTFIKYDKVINVNDPQIYGVPSGVYFQDRWKAILAQYVGYGNASGCVAGMDLSPGYISTSQAFIYPGAYMPCSSGQRKDDKVAYYLAYHKDLKWIPASAANLSSIPSQVSLNYNSLQLRYARILVNNFYVLGNIVKLNVTLKLIKFF